MLYKQQIEECQVIILINTQHYYSPKTHHLLKILTGYVV